MDRLRRDLAPVSDEAWAQIDEEAARALRHFLAARSLVDFKGPQGWELSSQSRGRVEDTRTPVQGVIARSRQVSPVVELRTPFSLARTEIDAFDRGSSNPDLDAVTEAARLAAEAEDRTVFDGGPAGLSGVAESSPHEPIVLTEDYGEYPKSVAQAVARLRRAGVEGPYGIALGDRCYTGVIETTEHGGYPVFEHVREIVEGPIIWAPAVDGALVVSIRGGDYDLFCGADFAVGYASHDDQTVELFIEESFTFQVHEPKAAVALRYS